MPTACAHVRNVGTCIRVCVCKDCVDEEYSARADSLRTYKVFVCVCVCVCVCIMCVYVWLNKISIGEGY